MSEKLNVVKNIRILAGVILLIIGSFSTIISYYQSSDSFAHDFLLSVGIETGVAGAILLFLEYFLFKENDEIANELRYYRELLKKNGILSENEFTTKIPDLCHISEKYHSYHQTRRNAEEKWMYNPINLKSDILTCKISGTRTTINKHGQSNTFNIEAGLRGNNLIIFYKKDKLGNHEVVIDVIHDFENANNQYYWGFRFHDTWDKNYSISPVLFSVKPLLDTQSKKPHVLTKEGERLVAEKWKALSKLHNIDPLIKKMY